MRRKTVKIHVTEDFFKFIRKKKAEDPSKYRTNYDVLTDLMGKPVERKRRRGSFFGKI